MRWRQDARPDPWQIKAIKKDRVAIFSAAAKDADLICGYMFGPVKKHEADTDHRDWITEN